jgi:hypothetical protein
MAAHEDWRRQPQPHDSGERPPQPHQSASNGDKELQVDIRLFTLGRGTTKSLLLLPNLLEKQEARQYRCTCRTIPFRQAAESTFD